MAEGTYAMDSKALAIDKRISIPSLALPIFFENFLRMMLNNINVFLVGRYSDRAVGAIGVSNQVNSFLSVVYGTIAFGAAVLISQNLGAGRRDTAARAANTALAAALALGLVFSLAVSVFSGSILKLMNLPPELMEYGKPYMSITGAVSFTQALITVMSAIARNYGRPRISMVVVLGMNLLNVTGNCIVIFRPLGLPEYGVYGMAVATLLSQLAAAIAMFRILFSRGGDLKFTFPRPFPFDTLKQLFRIGVPGGGDAMFFIAAQLMSMYFVTMLGAKSLTGLVYMQSIIPFIQLTGFAIGQAAQVMVGHLIGAGEDKRAYRLGYRSLWQAMACDMAVSVTFFLLARPLLGIYTQDADIIAIAVAVLTVDLFLEPGRAFNLVIGNSLRGTGDVTWPLVMSIASIWAISVPLSYLLGVRLGLGLPGVFIAFAADEWVRGQLMHLRWRTGAWKYKRVVKLFDKSELGFTSNMDNQA